MYSPYRKSVKWWMHCKSLLLYISGEKNLTQHLTILLKCKHNYLTRACLNRQRHVSVYQNHISCKISKWPSTWTHVWSYLYPRFQASAFCHHCWRISPWNQHLHEKPKKRCKARHTENDDQRKWTLMSLKVIQNHDTIAMFSPKAKNIRQDLRNKTKWSTVIRSLVY